MAVSHCDVLVVGGGPAGSTIAALLAERGRDVVLLEKSRHPRFHIGESLLPFNMPLFDRLGVGKEIEAIGMPKYGAEFVSPAHEKPVMFEFVNAMGNPFPSTYQVRRSQFDEILFRNAARKGATAIEDCRVTGVEFRTGGAEVSAREKESTERQWRTRFVVDASGRDTFLANRFRVKQRDPRNNTAAIYGHFEGARRLPGKAEGNISLFWFEHGWFWFIPLADGATSVGAVCFPSYLKSRKTDPEQFLLDTIALAPALAARLRDARLVSPVTATGNYSYAAPGCASGESYIMVGDAYAFIDPIFSTGVLLAMQSGFSGADVVETCLEQPRRSPRALKAYEADMRRGLHVFSWFIHRIMTPGLQYIFMHPGNQFQLRDALLAVLAGKIVFGKSLAARLLALKALYYLFSAARLGASLAIWRKRRQANQEAVIAP